MSHFHYLSDLGKIPLPSEIEIQEHYDKTGEQMILVLDSSVCIDIVNLVNWKQKSHSDKEKIFNLIEYSQKHKIKYFPIFALIESCYDRQSLLIQSDKFTDYSDRITFAFEYPITKFKRLQFDFFKEAFFLRTSAIESEIVSMLIDSRINPYYAAILKIYDIARNGIEKSRAEINICEFIDWMENDLGILLGLEYSLALQIFGGNSKFQSMIKFGAKKEIVLKAAWSTAWDFFHAKMSINNRLLSDLMDGNYHAIFVTKDIGLFNIMSPFVSSYVRRRYTKVSIIEGNEYPPKYSREFMEKLNNRMLELSAKRFNQNIDVDIEKVKNLIKNLQESLI